MMTREEWERYVKRMMHKPNSGISDNQGKEIFDFLMYDQTDRKDKNPKAFFRGLERRGDRETEDSSSGRAAMPIGLRSRTGSTSTGTFRAAPRVRSTRSAAGTCRPSASPGTKKAYLLARAPNPFAYVLGRICAHPCEDACRRGKIDEPIAICALKRYATDRHNLGAGARPGAQEPAAGAEARQEDRHRGRGRLRPHLRSRPGAAGVLGGGLRIRAGARGHALPGHPALPAAAGNHQDGGGQHPGPGRDAAHARHAGARSYAVRSCAPSSTRCCWPPASTKAAS